VLRRVWQAPGEVLERSLRPMLGMEMAFLTKSFICKSAWGVAFTWFVAYQYMYNKGDWTKQGGFKPHFSKPMTTPNMASFPLANPEFERTSPSDYNDQGFKAHPNSEQIRACIPLKW